MHRRASSYLITSILVLLGTAILTAQNTDEMVYFTIPEIALISLAPDNSAVELSLTVQGQPGEAEFVSGEDDSKYINYSSCVAVGSSSRAVFVEISAGELPSGVSLQVEVDNAMGVGDGAFGTSTGSLIVTSSQQKVLSGIGGAYTGVGAGNGHQITYTLVVDDENVLGDDLGTTPIVITYTLSDE